MLFTSFRLSFDFRCFSICSFLPPVCSPLFFLLFGPCRGTHPNSSSGSMKSSQKRAQHQTSVWPFSSCCRHLASPLFRCFNVFLVFFVPLHRWWCFLIHVDEMFFSFFKKFFSFNLFFCFCSSFSFLLSYVQFSFLFFSFQRKKVSCGFIQFFHLSPCFFFVFFVSLVLLIFPFL